MTTNIFDNLCILIVEDDKLGEGFVQDCRDNLHKPTVDWARTHDEGMAKVRSRGTQPYHVVFLDYFLPEHNAAGGKSINQTILTVIPSDTIVIHISAFAQHKDVISLHEAWSSQAQRSFHFVAKGIGFTQRAIKELKTATATSHFQLRFSELFTGDASIGQVPWARRQPYAPRTDISHSFAISEFCVDAADYWEFLDSPFQELLKQAFGFKMIGDKACLGVISSADTDANIISGESE